MKLATWNVAIPVATRRRDALRAHIDCQQADVWVLTETHDGFEPGLAHSHSSADGRDGLHAHGHRWVTIWSRHPLEPIVTTDGLRTAAARVRPDDDVPFIIFGTVLPWLGSPWCGFPSAGGVAFGEALSTQCADWLRLRRKFPNDELFVLGDFNQDLVDPHYYGSRANRLALEAALEAAGLVALTAGDRDPIRRDSARCACIDHICAPRDVIARAEPAVRWPDAPVPERRLSDHFGVSVSFDRSLGRTSSCRGL
jgi:hypothetical protein